MMFSSMIMLKVILSLLLLLKPIISRMIPINSKVLKYIRFDRNITFTVLKKNIFDDKIYIILYSCILWYIRSVIVAGEECQYPKENCNEDSTKQPCIEGNFRDPLEILGSLHVLRINYDFRKTLCAYL